MAQANAPKKEVSSSPVRIATFSFTSGADTLVSRFLQMTRRKYVAVEAGRGISFSCLDAPLDRSCLVHFEGSANAVIENGNDRHYITLSDVDLRIDTYPTRGYAYEHVNASMYKMNIDDSFGTRTIVVAYAQVLGTHPAHSFSTPPAPLQGLIPLGGTVKEARGLVEKESEGYHNTIKTKVLAGELSREDAYRMGFTPNSLARILGEGKKNSGKKKNAAPQDRTENLGSKQRDPAQKGKGPGKKANLPGDLGSPPDSTAPPQHLDASGNRVPRKTSPQSSVWGGDPQDEFSSPDQVRDQGRFLQAYQPTWLPSGSTHSAPQPPTHAPGPAANASPPSHQELSPAQQGVGPSSAAAASGLSPEGEITGGQPHEGFIPPPMAPGLEPGMLINLHRTAAPGPAPGALAAANPPLYTLPQMYSLVGSCHDYPPTLTRLHQIKSAGRTFFKKILFHSSLDPEAIPSLEEMPLVNIDIRTAAFEVCGHGKPSYLAILSVTELPTAVAVHNYVDLKCAGQHAG